MNEDDDNLANEDNDGDDEMGHVYKRGKTKETRNSYIKTSPALPPSPPPLPKTTPSSSKRKKKKTNIRVRLL